MSEYRVMNSDKVDDRPAGYVRALFSFKDDLVDVGASEREGQAVYKKPTEWVVIQVGDGPGASRTQHAVTDEDRRRYPEAYAAFKAGENSADVITGSPLKLWPAITKEMVQACERQGVRSIEALRDCGEDMLDRIGMGARQLKVKAIAHLDYAQNTGKAVEELASLRRSDDEKTRKLDEMQQQLNEFQEELRKYKKKTAA